MHWLAQVEPHLQSFYCFVHAFGNIMDALVDPGTTLPVMILLFWCAYGHILDALAGPRAPPLPVKVIFVLICIISKKKSYFKYELTQSDMFKYFGNTSQLGAGDS